MAKTTKMIRLVFTREATFKSYIGRDPNSYAFADSFMEELQKLEYNKGTA